MPVLNCSEFEQQLRNSVEMHEAPPEGIRQHSIKCDACRRLWEEYVLLDRALAAWKADTPSPDLADAVLAQHAFNQPETVESQGIEATIKAETRVTLRAAARSSEELHSARRRTGSFAVLASAVLVLLVVAGQFNTPRVEPPSIRDTPVASVQFPAQDPLQDADVQTAVRDAGSAYLNLARDAAGIFSDTVVLLPEPVLPPLGQTANESATEDLPEWSKEFDPIRRDVRNALDFLIEVIVADPEPAA